MPFSFSAPCSIPVLEGYLSTANNFNSSMGQFSDIVMQQCCIFHNYITRSTMCVRLRMRLAHQQSKLDIGGAAPKLPTAGGEINVGLLHASYINSRQAVSSVAFLKCLEP